MDRVPRRGGLLPLLNILNKVFVFVIKEALDPMACNIGKSSHVKPAASLEYLAQPVPAMATV